MAEYERGRPRKCIIGLIGMFALLLLGLGAWINYRFGRSALEITRNQFNAQQLVVARGIRHWIEQQIDLLGHELTLAAESLEDPSADEAQVQHKIQLCFSRVIRLGVSSIEVLAADGHQKHIYYPFSGAMETEVAHSLPETDRSARLPGEPLVMVSPTIVTGSELSLRLVLLQKDEKEEKLAFVVNLSRFLTPYLKQVRSGRTGYAWIIDAQGTFLYHPQHDFMGKSAFEARQDRSPDFSHTLIDAIQRDKMLKSLEGQGFYHSTWHRGITGRIEKMIAYTPVVMSTQPDRNWSVAVVAPVYEIEEDVNRIYRWGAVSQGLIVLVVVAAISGLWWIQVRWSRHLEDKVAARTLALQRSEENYRSLVESAEDFIFSVDEDGHLISVNNFTAAFFGSRPEIMIGGGLEQLFPENVTDRLHKIIQTVFSKGKSIRNEFEWMVEDREFWISANFMPLKDQFGNMNAVLCIARDITENKKLERSLIHTEKLASLGTLAAGVAHEINNPLGIMLGFCDLLVRKKQPGTQEYEDLKIIERHGLYCKQIVENLLSFARTGNETTGDMDLNLCLQNIIQVVKHSVEMKSITLETDLAGDLPRIVGDDRQLQQVFCNLMTNAVAAMPDGGVLKVRTCLASGGRCVIAQIQDNGIGIAPEHLDLIFEPFFTTKPEGEGTGLGLFVSYGIVQKFGGTIVCESQCRTPGKNSCGTTFSLELAISKGA